jgi:adenylate kinase family enzyme
VADLLVVTGPPGAGKSTVSQLLAADFDPGALVAGDQFFGFLRAGFIDPWRPESDKQNEVVTQSAAAAVGKLVQGGITVVYDGVVGPWFVPAFLAGTGLDRLDYAVLMPEEVCCARRVRERSGHGFTDIPATRHMYREFASRWTSATRRRPRQRPSDSAGRTVRSCGTGKSQALGTPENYADETG